VQDGVVLRQHLGGKDLHAARRGQRDQVLQQQRGDTMPVPAIGHRHRHGHLRGRPVASELIAGHPRQLIAQQADQAASTNNLWTHARSVLLTQFVARRLFQDAYQRHHARTVVRAYPPGLRAGGHPARAEEPEIQVLQRHRLGQPFDRVVIPRTGPPYGRRGAISQQRLSAPAPCGPRGPGQPIASASAAGLVTCPSSPVRDPVHILRPVRRLTAQLAFRTGRDPCQQVEWNSPATGASCARSL